MRSPATVCGICPVRRAAAAARPPPRRWLRRPSSSAAAVGEGRFAGRRRGKRIRPEGVPRREDGFRTGAATPRSGDGGPTAAAGAPGDSSGPSWGEEARGGGRGPLPQSGRGSCPAPGRGAGNISGRAYPGRVLACCRGMPCVDLIAMTFHGHEVEKHDPLWSNSCRVQLSNRTLTLLGQSLAASATSHES